MSNASRPAKIASDIEVSHPVDGRTLFDSWPAEVRVGGRCIGSRQTRAAAWTWVDGLSLEQIAEFVRLAP